MPRSLFRLQWLFSWAVAPHLTTAVDANISCNELLDVAGAVVAPAPLLGRHEAVGAGRLERMVANLDLDVLIGLCPLSVGAALNNLGVLAMVDSRPQGGFEQSLAKAHSFLYRAMRADPGSIIVIRNLAWFVHQTTSSKSKVDRAYVHVANHAVLMYALAISKLESPVACDEIEKHLLAPFSQSCPNSSKWSIKLNFSTTAGGFWDVTVTSSGSGEVVVSASSAVPARCDTPTGDSSSEPHCAKNMRANGATDPLSQRLEQISVFELHADLCKEPLGPPNDRYLRLLKEVLVGFHDSALGDVNRSKFLKSKPWAMGLSFVAALGLRSTHHLEQRHQVGLTLSSGSMLNFLRLAVESIVARRIPGDLLEAGVWRGGSAMWMWAVLRHLEEHGTSNDDSHRSLWLADSFTGVPDARDKSGFPDDVWHHVDPHAYATSLALVWDAFEMLGLLDDAAAQRLHVLPGLFNETLVRPPIPARLSLVRIDADSYESVSDAFSALYPSLSPGSVLIIDDWHLNGARHAVLEHRQRHRWDAPLLPVPEDYVYTCRQGTRFGVLEPHTSPAAQPQGAFFVMGGP